jgi:hypothetical protein
MFAGAIAGVSTGVVLVVVGLIVFFILLFRRRAALVVPTLADADIGADWVVEPDSNERAHSQASLLDETAPAPALRFRARGPSSARARARAGDALALADGGKANAVTASAGTVIVRGGKGTTRPKRARTPLADDGALPAV